MEWDKIEQILGIAMATVALDGGKQYLDWRKKKKEDAERPKKKNEDLKTRADIKLKMVEIRMVAECNRVDLFEFGNGKMTHGGISLEFVYCTLEDVDNKTAGMSERFQGIPAATMNKTLVEINESPKGWTRFDDRSEDETANQRRRYWGIMSSYNFKITNEVTEGMIGLHFMHEYGTISDENIQEILRLIEDIRNLMTKLVKKETMNIWQRLRWAMTFWVVFMIIHERETIVSNYKKSFDKPTISAILNKDLQAYHEKKYNDGK